MVSILVKGARRIHQPHGAFDQWCRDSAFVRAGRISYLAAPNDMPKEIPKASDHGGLQEKQFWPQIGRELHAVALRRRHAVKLIGGQTSKLRSARIHILWLQKTT